MFNIFWPKLPDSWESCPGRPGRSDGWGLENLQQTKVGSRINSWTLLLFDILDQWNSGPPSCSSLRTLPTTTVTRSKNDLRIDFFLLSSHQVPRVRSSKAVSRGLRHQEDSDSDGQRGQARRGGLFFFMDWDLKLLPPKEKRLWVGETEVGVVYMRCGYHPDQYPTQR